MNLSAEQFADEIRTAAAAKLYELGRLSSGRAAELAGVSRVRFLHELQCYGVAAVTLSEEELNQDVMNAAP
jgi:predicted HTH domain antitoxin